MGRSCTYKISPSRLALARREEEEGRENKSGKVRWFWCGASVARDFVAAQLPNLLQHFFLGGALAFASPTSSFAVWVSGGGAFCSAVGHQMLQPDLPRSTDILLANHLRVGPKPRPVLLTPSNPDASISTPKVSFSQTSDPDGM